MIPARKVAVCSPCWPMRMVFASSALPLFPMSILLLPVVRLEPALTPMAVFEIPVALAKRAATPTAVLVSPVVLLNRGKGHWPCFVYRRVAKKRVSAGGGVAGAGGIENQGIHTDGRVDIAGGIDD